MGWSTYSLESLCKEFTDGNWVESKDQSPEGIRLIQTGNVGEGVFKDRGDKARYISEATFSKLKCFEIFEGDCLISRLPDPVGRSCVLPDTGERMITAVDCTVVRFDTRKILPEYFNFYSQSNTYISDVDALTSGATRKRISRKNLGKVEIPIPSIPEQTRIVAILDQAFADIDKARALTEQNLKNAGELFRSYLQKLFSQRGDRWGKEKFGNVCKFVRGPFGGALKKNIFKPSGIAVYEQKHAIYNQFSEIRYFIDEEKYKEMERFELFPGDLIMSCSGTMGKIAIVPDGIEKGIINQALLKLTPETSIDREFLKIWMQSKNFQAEIESRAQGAAIQNMASVKILKEIEMPLPSIDEQREIVELYKDMEFQSGTLFELYLSKQGALDELKKSLLQKAFAGELTKDREEAAA